MSKNTNTKVPNPENPSSLKSRYEIRKLEPHHLQWVNAIMCHSNTFHSGVWPLIYDDIGGRVLKLVDGLEYLVKHQIDSGLSYGVFDTEYEYKTEEAKKVGGKLYWNSEEPGVFEEQGLKAEGERLLEQMDFPLVSVALSYDGAHPLDMTKMADAMEALPHFGLIYHVLGDLDTRDPASWQATAPGEVLMRNGTSTRNDYEGEKIMSGMARWLIREAAAKGYRGIQIECLADAVSFHLA